MTTDAKIEPALTAKEWKNVAVFQRGLMLAFENPEADGFEEIRISILYGKVYPPGDELAGERRQGCVELVKFEEPEPTEGVEIREEHAPVVIAALNAILPDNSPHKITRADVRELLDAASAMENADVWRDPHPENASPLRSIATKLAALLPPE